MTELACKRLIIFGVDRDMMDGDLTAHFEKFGRVTKVYNTKKGCAFVSFQNEETANMAKRELDQTTMNGRIITVEIAKPKEEILDSDSERHPAGGLVGSGSLDRGGESESESRGGSGDSVGYEVIEENRSGIDDRNIEEILESVRHLGGIGGEEDSSSSSSSEENTENIVEERDEVKVTKERVKHRKRFDPKLETIEELWESDLGVRDVEVDTEVSSSSSPQENEMVGPEIEVKGETIGWLPPDIPSVKDFRCVCSYVDYNVILSVSTKEQVETRRQINTVLENYYVGSEPSSTDKDWVSGERCIARFMLDGKWYRAAVVTTDITRVWVLVLFVDNGNMEWCKEEELRRNVLFMAELPIQSLTVQLETPGYSPEIWRKLDSANVVHMKLVDNKELVLRLDKDRVSACLRGAGRVEYEFDMNLII